MPYYANIHSDSFCSDFWGNDMTGAARHFAHFMMHNVTAIVYTLLQNASNSTLWWRVFYGQQYIIIMK